MLDLKLALFSLLLPAALAYPKHSGPFKSGLNPASGPFPTGIATGPFGTENGTASPITTGSLRGHSTLHRTLVKTLTLDPSPVSNSEAPTEAASVIPSLGDKHLHISNSDTSLCTVATVTVTSQDTVTVTVGVGEPKSIATSVTFAKSATQADSQALVSISKTSEQTEPTQVSATPAPAIQASTSSTVVPKTTEAPTPIAEASRAATSTIETSKAPASVVINTTPSETPKDDGAAAVGSSTGSSGVSTKRGVLVSGDDTLALVDAFSKSPKISWLTDWGSWPPSNLPSTIQFVPEMYGKKSDLTGEWTTNAKKTIAAGATHFLGFGEPELPGDLQMTPQEAVDLWMKELQPYADQVKIGAPSVVQTGLDWLAEFLTKCEIAGCKIGFVSVHWFWKSDEQGRKDFKDVIGKAIKLANNRPLWVPNFGCSGDREAQKSFLDEMLPFLDGQKEIERYAFVALDKEVGFLEQGGGLSTLGQFYADYPVGG